MQNKTPTPRPTAAELDLLRILWHLGPADARTVHETLVLERPDASYATVLRQLQLMHGKGMLTRDESQRPQRYAAVQAQENLQTGLLKDLITKVFAGSGKALILAALKEHVSADERSQIEKILNRKDGSSS
jgi:predicted transcriptional regulator